MVDYYMYLDIHFTYTLKKLGIFILAQQSLVSFSQSNHLLQLFICDLIY